MKRRPVSPFSLSFLDIMFCGFGAVVLLVLILNTDAVRARNKTFEDLRSEVMRLEQSLVLQRQHLAKGRDQLEATQGRLAESDAQAQQVQARIRALNLLASGLSHEAEARREQVDRLAGDLIDLDRKTSELAEQAAGPRPGERVHELKGEGDRQYLTGLKLGGERVLILLDASASMLDETIVNVVRRRNMNEAQKRLAPKWQRALATVEWLISNLPPGGRFQLYAFNTVAESVVPGSAGRWLNANDRQEVDAAVQGLRRTLPGGGTSLYRAFEVAGQLSPRPDNILLITDSLPTQGKRRPLGSKVSAEKRLALFRQAADSLPPKLPVNTILLPMEGDAYAAAAYWKLALDTRGSLLTPARDWP
jgi:hypothetical protein